MGEGGKTFYGGGKNLFGAGMENNFGMVNFLEDSKNIL